MIKYTVILSHASNPDIPGGYRTGMRPPKLRVEVETVKQASKVCREYIEANQLGGGNWTGGKVFVGAVQIARISYNGRIWANDGNEITVYE